MNHKTNLIAERLLTHIFDNMYQSQFDMAFRAADNGPVPNYVSSYLAKGHMDVKYLLELSCQEVTGIPDYWTDDLITDVYQAADRMFFDRLKGLAVGRSSTDLAKK